MFAEGFSLSFLAFQGTLTLAKVTLVAAGAIGLSIVLKGAPASARHSLWTATLIVLLALPALALFPGALPSIGVPGFSFTPSAAGHVLLPPVERSVFLGPTSEGGQRDPLEGEGRVASGTHAASGPEFDGAPGSSSALGGASAGPTGTLSLPPDLDSARQPTASVAVNPWTALFLGWLVGVFLILLPLAFALARARRIIRRSRAVRSLEWVEAIESARRRVGFRERVEVRLAPGAATAMAGGVLRPVILLPEGASCWSPELREIVLLHEFVHLHRRDPARQLLGRVVLALYWFHPLVWWVVRSAALDRETACDEKVIEFGQRPSVYARHLLDFPAPLPRSLAGLAAFHHPDLESRLMAILNPTPRSLRPRAGLMIAAVGLFWVATVAALGPAGVEAPVSAEEVASPPDLSTPAQAATEPLAFPSGPTEPGASTSEPAEPLASTVAHPESVATTSGLSMAQYRCPDPGTPMAGARWSEGREGQSWIMRHALGDLNLCFGGNGDIEWSEDRVRIVSMSLGSVVELVVSGEGGTQRLEIVEEGDGARTLWEVNGEERAVTPEVLEWRDALLAYFGARFEHARTRGQEARLRGEIARIHGGEARLRGEEARIRGEAARIQGEEARIRGEEARLRGDLARLAGEEARIRGEIGRVRGEEARLRSHLSRVNIELRSLRRAQDRLTSPDAHAGVDAAIAELTSEAEQIAGEIEALRVRDRVAELETLLAEHRAATSGWASEIQQKIDDLRTDERVAGVRQELAAHRLATEGRIEEIQAELTRSREESQRRIRETEAEIEALDTSARVEAIEQRIEELERRVLEAIRRVGFEGGVR